ncbi:MAG TPA: Sec-independent protein translocase subunit TatA [Jatrophihabitans sp.]|nr:Sec-independent protein translocase subunit TatA [Jatrophihabitans sp.]
MGGWDAPSHWIVLAIVALVLFFGWKNLPDMSRSLGRSLRIFKTEIKGMTEDDKAREQAEQQPRALPPAEVVRNETAAPTRPRPTPRPNATTPGQPPHSGG